MIPALFDKISGLTALVIGDVMIDYYSFGKASRISPEAPVPVVNITHKELRLGGAANVAKNIRAMGARCILCSVIGDDDNANEFLKLIEKNQINPDALVKSESRKTSVKHRVLSGSQQLLRMDEEDLFPLSTEENNRLLQNIEEIIPKIDVIILQDYDKGVLTSANIPLIIEKAKKHGIPVAVDPKMKNFLSYKGVNLFKPNLSEIETGLKIRINASDKNEVKNAVTMLKDQLDIENVLLTLSEKGLFVSFGDLETFIPTEAKSISDVSGAGDTVISVAALLLALNTEPELLAKISNLAGGIVCEKLGVVPINKAELIERSKNL